MNVPALERGRVYVGFTASQNLLGSLIRLGEGGGHVSHVFTLVRLNQANVEGWYDLGANPRGLYPRFLGEEGPVFDDDVVELWEGPSLLEKGMRANRDKIGQPYDFPGLVGMLPVEVAERVFHVRMANLIQSKRRVFCSEFVAKVIADEGLSLPIRGGDKPATVDPEELATAFAVTPGWRCVWRRPEPKPEPAVPLTPVEGTNLGTDPEHPGGENGGFG